MSDPSSRATAAERFQWGRSLRKIVPLSSHAQLGESGQRDPIGLIKGQETGRLSFLLPTRQQRMRASPFAFYRGSAVVQAADLAATPVSGILVQLCGDAHLSNFGLYGSPERRLVFDVNDFDETLPGPFEWDVKRLGASIVLAGRALGHEEAENERSVCVATAAYRETLAQFSDMRYIDAWYAKVDAEELQRRIAGKKAHQSSGTQRMLDAARTKDCLRALRKLAVEVNGEYQIKSQPPNIVPLREMPREQHPDDARHFMSELFKQYKESLPDARACLIHRYRLVDLALKVVGVGSVGTRCFVALLEGRDKDDPLFLQIKEASPSVLETHLPKSTYRHAGQRVVEGQRLMQVASDIFLGWTRDHQKGRDYYVRQMWDMKGSADVESFTPRELRDYAAACGWTLAHGHSRTGSASAISGYLGEDDVFDKAIGRFARAYADQAEADHAAFASAIHPSNI